MPTRRVAVVPHTHWDREWYEPFQTFRMHLVELLDNLIPLMEHDPSYRRFMLDGQMAVVDDYLEVRPEMEDRLRALAASGRITMGPWYILMDEFLVSGETMWRDLQLGIAKGAAFGGVMDVGYLPDMFGHVAQMPQILAQGGFGDAVLWRGVPSAVDRTAFRWEAPDGSGVRVEYLPTGYGNGASLPESAEDLLKRVRDHVDEIGEFLFDQLLLMNGSDHLHPQPFLGRVLAEANTAQDDFRFEITSLPEYLAQVSSEGLVTWRGELRSGWRANMLMGVTSNRVDVKLAEARTTAELERRAEPLSALFSGPEAWPQAMLDIAWREVIRNSAHDSICACSVDEVVDAVLHRFHEARRIGEGISTTARKALAASLATPGATIVNLDQRSRGGVVELVVADEVDTSRVQVLSERGGLPSAMTLDAETIRTVMGMLQGPKIDNDAWIQGISIEDHGERLSVTLTIGAHEVANVPIAEAKQDLYTLIGARPDLLIDVAMVQPPIRRVLAKVDPIAGYGWKAFEAASIAKPAVADAGKLSLSNGLVEVIVDAQDGTFAIDGLAGYGKLVDDGDLGDSYNYSPPALDSVVDRPEAVSARIIEEGPVRATIEIASTYRWPASIDEASQERVGEVTTVVTTLVSVLADSSVVAVETSFVNPARDHRLRIHLPLPVPATSSRAECAYTIVERGLTAEGRPDEYGLPTAPSRRFVTAGGLTVAHEGLNEYELIDVEGDSARTLAFTALRATAMLSRLGMAYRPFPAGPLTPVEGLQMVGKEVRCRYHIAGTDVDPYALAADLHVPLEAVHAEGGGSRERSGCALRITGAEVSALRRVAGGTMELRVFNPTDAETTVDLDGRRGWLVDLRGQAIEPVDSSFALRAQGIATVWLEADELP